MSAPIHMSPLQEELHPSTLQHNPTNHLAFPHGIYSRNCHNLHCNNRMAVHITHHILLPLMTCNIPHSHHNRGASIPLILCPSNKQFCSNPLADLRIVIMRIMRLYIPKPNYTFFSSSLCCIIST